MVDEKVAQVLSVFTLNENQKTAVITRGNDVVVTAGAGSGKTSTLVARYVSLLAEGVSPRRIAAITFTKKAALEMRSRVRKKLVELQRITDDPEEQQKWGMLSTQMDSARIGTIHSLCTEILRNHPAEAGIDPRFGILDEGISLALRAQAVDDSLNQLVTEEKLLPLLKNVPINTLSKILKEMLGKRLVAQEAFATSFDPRKVLVTELQNRMNHPDTGGWVAELREYGPKELVDDAGDLLAENVTNLLTNWDNAEKSLKQGDAINCAMCLYDIRRNNLKKGPGKKTSEVKEIIAELQTGFDNILNPLTGGKSTGGRPSQEAEALYESLLPLLRDSFSIVHGLYQQQVRDRQMMDFDDLEFHAQELLQNEGIRHHWQGELDAILVDEYQDTNQRQRDIVNALAGDRGNLFIVGDMRQSIYRFRQADVTVFREEQERIKTAGGCLIDLDRTYRAHEQLLDATGDLLSAAIGTDEDPNRKYYVPYSPLVSDKKEIPEGIVSPHVEFVFGAGSDAVEGRNVAAQAMAARLLELKEEKQIKSWDEVALLFRASTGFPYYEEVFENAGIPFVTVAGQGFYDRPEIRDLINILRTLSDPTDDLAFAGLLRSPAFGLSDAGLYQLRKTGLPYLSAIQGDISFLSAEDRESSLRTSGILNKLIPLVDRIPVADLIKQVVDALDYRAILASADIIADGKEASNAGGRLWRNLDKLIEDAQVGVRITLRDFLDMLSTLNDAGAREGEAPSESDGSVRLMTIHKSKGLEFPVVILADSGRQVRAQGELVYFSKDLGISFKLENPPILYNLAKSVDKDQGDCEAFRLLYVAMTRAMNKLIISGHMTINNEGKTEMASWAKLLDEKVSFPSVEYLKQAGQPFLIDTGGNHPLRAWCLMNQIEFAPVAPITTLIKDEDKAHLAPLYLPVDGFDEVKGDEEEPVSEKIRELSGQARDQIPGNMIGTMVHKAVQRWLFPDAPELKRLLSAESYNLGLANQEQRNQAMKQAERLLDRFQKHPLWKVINQANHRYHELPYTILVNGNMESRVIDLLYSDGSQWHLIDFKTDPIRTEEQKRELIQKYIPQLRAYCAAVKQTLGLDPAGAICLLDDMGQVSLVFDKKS